MLSQDEFTEMMQWAFGDDWRQVNIKHSQFLFQFNHPNYLPLEQLDVPNPLLNGSFYIVQIYKYWLQDKDTINNTKELSNEPSNTPTHTDSIFERLCRWLRLYR